MAEDKSNAAEELRKELESAREKNKRLEQMLEKEELEVARKEGLLNELYRRMMLDGVMDKEEIARAVGKEQYEALSYHLAKEHEKRMLAEKSLLTDEERLKLDERRLTEDAEMLRRESERINQLESELTFERRRRIELEKKVVEGYAPGKIDSEIEDYPTLGPKDVKTIEKAQLQLDQRRSLTSKDLFNLMLRVGRIKALDAGIVLNTGKEHIIRLARPLVKSGYIEIQGEGGKEPTLQALKKLLDMRKS
ncbi:MAG: hypothetical protein PHG85_07425 [Candidatus Altiarchaeota archaeon]|nr:hypothetical protein [Candidatus Altiarchaeota archaeon]